MVATWLMLLAGDYRRNVFSTLRRLVLLVLVAAGIFYFAASMPAYNFRLVGAYQHAAYDITIGDPAGEGDLAPAFAELRSAGATWTSVTVATLDRVRGSREARSVEAMFYRPSEWRDASWTYFSRGLLLAGATTPDFVGIDRLTARALGVGLGDRLEYELPLVTEDGGRRVRGQGRVGAVYATTDLTRGLIAPLPSALTAADSTTLPEAVRVFAVVEGSPDAIAERLRGLTYDGQPVVETLPEGFRRGQRTFERTVDRNVRFSLTWIGLGLYAMFAVRELLGRFTRRSKAVATLLSMGMSGRSLFGLLASEQVVLAACTGAAGFLVGAVVLERLGGLYVPPDVLLAFAMYSTAANGVVLAVTALVLRRRMSKLAIASVLSAP